MISKAIETNSIGYHIKSVTILICMGFLAFWATFQSPFLYDDYHAIIENPYIQQLGDFQQSVGIENIFNRSVLLLTFAMNREIGGLDVFGYHLANILIHVMTGIVWYFLVQELLLLEPPKQRHHRLPLICAAIHLLNPLSVETVTYISSRSSGLATLFYLLAFYTFAKLVRRRNENIAWAGKVLFILGIVGFLFLGVGTKEIVVTFPLMAIIYIWLMTPIHERKNLKTKIGAILFPLLLYFCYRYMEQGNIFSVNSDPVSGETSRYLYFLSQIKVAVNYYLLKLSLPINLNFEPDIRLLSGLLDIKLILSFLILGVVAFIVFHQKSTVFQFAVLWFFITLLPSSSFVPLKQIAIEHRTYLPGLGFSLLMGWLLLSSKPSRNFSAGLLSLFIAFNFMLTVNRSLDYRSEVSLWEDTVTKSPNKSLVHNNLATSYMDNERLEEAEIALANSLKLKPEQSDPYANLGHIQFRREDWLSAIKELDHAIELGSQKSNTFYFAGLARNKMNSYAEAIPYLKEAVKIQSHIARYHFDLGEAYRHTQLFDEALHEFRQTLNIQPEHPQAQNNIGVIFWNLKAFDKAESAFKKALSIQSDLPDIHHNLGALYLKTNRFGKAVPHLETVLKLQPENTTARPMLEFALRQGNGESQ